jgi:tRNA-specific 2-thiouridylase
MAYNKHMDMKKKLEEAYLPDKESRRERVVVALSGGVNSFVAAYLLKIQKYDLIGVTVALNLDNYKEDSSGLMSCHLSNPQLETIKKFCHQIGIPHFVVKASDEFQEEVAAKWLGSRMTGTKPNPCWNCHELRMRLLFSKMVELDAKKFATGHLAKLFRHEAHHSVYVHSSNDETHDQSSLLSRLPHDVLDKLILPLSDLQQKEVDKLAENFGLIPESKKVKIHDCFKINYAPEGYLDVNIPKKYLKTGEVIGLDKTPMGDHLGIHHYKYGEEYTAPNLNLAEPMYVSKFSVHEKKLEISKASFFVQKKIFLTQCKMCEETSLAEPLHGVIKIKEGESIDCWIFPKSLSSAVIELESPHFIPEGEMVTILKKKGKNAKVYCTGIVKYIIEEPTDRDQGNERVKVDYSRDF